MHRPAVTLTAAQWAATSLSGFGPVPTRRVRTLVNREWLGNGHTRADDRHTQVAHDLPGGRTLVVELSPGLPAAPPAVDDEHQVTEIWVDDEWSDHWQASRRTPIGVGDFVAVSELLVELYGDRVLMLSGPRTPSSASVSASRESRGAL
jgi:hypothetical protein